MRTTKVLGEPAVQKRLQILAHTIVSLELPKGSRILDVGGNNFKNFCDKQGYEYTCIDLHDPQKHGTGGYHADKLTYDGVTLPFRKDDFDLIICSFVLHHCSAAAIGLLKQMKDISTNHVIIGEDLADLDYPIKWHERNFHHQKNGIFRSDTEWCQLFELVGFKLEDKLALRYLRDKEFSDPMEFVYRIYYTLSSS